MKRHARVIAASISPVKRLGLLALVFAFALQSYFVQTHLHPQQFAPAQAMAMLSDGLTPDVAPDLAPQLPADPLDPITCKLCREIVHAGAAITPAAPALLLLLDWIATSIPAAQLPAAALAPETGWQSRGPPTH
jgi:hypothetical protein